jgi:cellulose 1,4-beta-cellobiosidase
LTWATTSTANAYQVERSASSGGPYQIVTTVTGNSYQDSGLTDGQTYYYVISAINQAGEGAVSAHIAVVPTPPSPPGAPGGLSAQVGGGDPQPFFGGGIAILSWSTVPNTVTYNVKRSRTSGGPYTALSSSIAPSYTDLNISNGTTYYYVVSAVNSFGESTNSNEISATPNEEIRKAPQIYNAQSEGGNVFLAWNPDPLTTPQFGTAFNVKRSDTSGGPYTTVVMLNTYNAFDYTAVPGTTYYYVVSATNAAGESANSNEVSVAAGGP